MPSNKRLSKNIALLRDFALFGAIWLVAISVVYVHFIKNVLPIPRDGTSLVVGRDFLDFWMYGRAAHSAQPWRWYDVTVYNHEIASMFGTGYPGRNWSYPPSVMLLAAPFGLISYLQALLLWTIGGLIVLAAVIRQLTREPFVLIAALASPAAVFCLISGQNALFTSAILVCVFSNLDRRPLFSGILIGILTLKPHVGILLPLVLVASSRWRVLAAASISTVAIAACTAALFGVQSWAEFLDEGIRTDGLVLMDTKGLGAPFFPTIFMNLHGVGVNHSLAISIQAASALVASGAVAWAFRFCRNASPLILLALFAACTNAALPYLVIYDTLPLTIAALFLLADDQFDVRGRILVRFIYWLPLLQLLFGTLHLPGPALVAPTFAIYLLTRLYREPALRVGKCAPSILSSSSVKTRSVEVT
jgi:hypothetical protein